MKPTLLDERCSSIVGAAQSILAMGETQSQGDAVYSEDHAVVFVNHGVVYKNHGVVYENRAVV